MEEDNSAAILHDVARFLAARSDLYTGGIPLRYLESTEEGSFSRLLFVRSDGKDSESALTRELTLYRKVIVDGMKVDPSRATLIELSRFSQVTDFTDCICVFLGEETYRSLSLDQVVPFGSPSFGGEFPVLVTFSLGEVLASQEKKREFWGHLKLLLPLLRDS
ncbi:MAG: hypothetical protein KDD64_12840 [Bdellovibrionales bacterium]|nr:hypothetical protein [Bdellovibrionales bacterium]